MPVSPASANWRRARSSASATSSSPPGDDIDAEEGLFETEDVEHGFGRRPRPHEPGGLAQDPIDQVVGDLGLRGLFPGKRPSLRALEQPPLRGHAQVAVEPRRDGPLAKQRFVDVHHLGRAQGAGALGAEANGDLTSAPGIHGEHGGMHLDSCGDADHGDPVADRLEDVDGRPVSTGEEQQVDPFCGHGRRGRASVGTRS